MDKYYFTLYFAISEFQTNTLPANAVIWIRTEYLFHIRFELVTVNILPALWYILRHP